jgi:ribosomal protein S6E (S10)
VVAARRLLSLAALALLGCSDAGGAAVKQGITPANLAQRLASAKPGETLRLPPGDYGAVVLPSRSFSPAVRIDAAAARFTGLVLNKVEGVTVAGGTIVGPGGKSYGVRITGGKDLRIENMAISGANRGIVIDRSSDIAIVGNRLANLGAEGINIALSRRVLIQRNSCRDFNPTPAVYAAGKLVRDGDHPDCIQAWSRPTAPPTSDIQVLDNEADGKMQGVFFGNHARNGVDDGGFDRIVIRGNRIRVAFPNGIYLADARGSEVSGNRISTIPGSVLPKNGRPIRAKLYVTGTGNRVCGNILPEFAGTPETAPCR